VEVAVRRIATAVHAAEAAEAARAAAVQELQLVLRLKSGVSTRSLVCQARNQFTALRNAAL
jgi:hypothetical protein